MMNDKNQQNRALFNAPITHLPQKPCATLANGIPRKLGAKLWLRELRCGFWTGNRQQVVLTMEFLAKTLLRILCVGSAASLAAVGIAIYQQTTRKYGSDLLLPSVAATATFLYPSALIVLLYEWKNPVFWLSSGLSMMGAGGLVLCLTAERPAACNARGAPAKLWAGFFGIWLCGLLGAVAPALRLIL